MPKTGRIPNLNSSKLSNKSNDNLPPSKPDYTQPRATYKKWTKPSTNTTSKSPQSNRPTSLPTLPTLNKCNSYCKKRAELSENTNNKSETFIHKSRWETNRSLSRPKPLWECKGNSTISEKCKRKLIDSSPHWWTDSRYCLRIGSRSLLTSRIMNGPKRKYHNLRRNCNGSDFSHFRKMMISLVWDSRYQLLEIEYRIRSRTISCNSWAKDNLNSQDWPSRSSRFRTVTTTCRKNSIKQKPGKERHSRNSCSAKISWCELKKNWMRQLRNWWNVNPNSI